MQYINEKKEHGMTWRASNEQKKEGKEKREETRLITANDTRERKESLERYSEFGCATMVREYPFLSLSCFLVCVLSSMLKTRLCIFAWVWVVNVDLQNETIGAFYSLKCVTS